MDNDNEQNKENTSVESLKTTVEKLEAENKRMEENLKKQEELIALQRLGGTTISPQPVAPKVETAKEYAEKVMAGKIK